MNEAIVPSSNGNAPAAAMPERHDFSTIRTAIPIPNLIEMQRESYKRFLQMELLPGEREDIGLEAVFKSVFPISDFREMSSLEFVSYSIGDWNASAGHLRDCSICGLAASIAMQRFRAIPKGLRNFSAANVGPSPRTTSRSAKSAGIL